MFVWSAITLGLVAQLAQAASVPCDPKVLDEASTHIIFLSSNIDFPITSEGLTESCPKSFSALQTANDYVDNCVGGLAKGMLKLVFEGASKEINSKCVEGAKEREEYLNMAECIILKAGKPIQACNAKVNAIFEATLAKPKKDRIPLSCWYAFMSSTHKIESCANKVARQVNSIAATKGDQ
ncbi:uncharacterized protein LOC111270693 [Varroa jacobsoni]|uniref:uncharacterized protein LOC111270693 n=1 Tax=Varroa jacobsoni TaxID=62625 RepID=UPI000BF5CFF3|nr:uncharacterized protein LOC111270693 [Varroa jacobsoni]